MKILSIVLSESNKCKHSVVTYKDKTGMFSVDINAKETRKAIKGVKKLIRNKIKKMNP